MGGERGQGGVLLSLVYKFQCKLVLYYGTVIMSSEVGVVRMYRMRQYKKKQRKLSAKCDEMTMRT